MKRKLVSLAQLAVACAILAYIFSRLQRRGDLAKLQDTLANAAQNWPLLALGAVGFGLCLFFCLIRWQILLKAQDIHLSLGRLATLQFIGHFFNAFMFGATGGDVVKAYYVARESHHKRTEVVTTVFIDRIMGLIALILLTVIVMVGRLRFFLSRPETRAAMVFNLLLLAATVAALLLVFRKDLAERSTTIRRLEEATPLGTVVRKVYAAFRMCLNRRDVVLKTTALSLLNHLTLVVSNFYFGMALGVPLGFLDYLTVTPVISAVAALPLTPAGLGTRESVSLYLLGALGVPGGSAVALSLLTYAAVMSWSVLGGIVYLVFASRQGYAPPEAETED